MAVVVAPVQSAALTSREHEAIHRGCVARCSASSERDRFGPRHLAGRAAFRERHDRGAAEQLDLLAHVQTSTEEVNGAHSQPERLALAEPTPGGHDRDCSPPLRV